MLLRKANQFDTQFLYEIRNEDEARKNSGYTGPVDYERYRKQTDLRFKSKSSRIYIGEVDGEDFGYFIIDYQKLSYPVVSVGILPKFRGRGLASELIKDGIDHYSREFKNCTHLLAVIKKTNEKSIRSFTKCHFMYHDYSQDGVTITMIKRLPRWPTGS